VIFTAANVYLGLKIGLTFATSIPAAVISMAVLRQMKGSTIQENNIVQTIASAAGTLSAIIFVLPGLLMIGWWVDFPYWQSVAVIGVGGILGVMYSVPLRRALVTGTDLPYPEGVAAAEVLKVGAASGEGDEENRKGLDAIVAGTGVSMLYTILAKLGLVAEEAARPFRIGASLSQASTSFSMALIGVGHLVGLGVGVAMLVGMVLSWGFLVPYYTHGVPGDAAAIISTTFKMKVRIIGAGTIGIAAVYTLLRDRPHREGHHRRHRRPAPASGRARRLAGPDRAGSAHRHRGGGDRGGDDPHRSAAGQFCQGWADRGAFLAGVDRDGGLCADHRHRDCVGLRLHGGADRGFQFASVGHGDHLGHRHRAAAGGVLRARDRSGGDQALVAFSLFVTAIVFGVATISNDNLQDLKTGELVGATPWRQQVALVLGVVFGALVIPPVLSLLNARFGFVGVPGAGPMRWPRLRRR
jgi:uncharacterized oligopeptide transporter (OPT) family protein